MIAFFLHFSKYISALHFQQVRHWGTSTGSPKESKREGKEVLAVKDPQRHQLPPAHDLLDPAHHLQVGAFRMRHKSYFFQGEACNRYQVWSFTVSLKHINITVVAILCKRIHHIISHLLLEHFATVCILGLTALLEREVPVKPIFFFHFKVTANCTWSLFKCQSDDNLWYLGLAYQRNVM